MSGTSENASASSKPAQEADPRAVLAPVAIAIWAKVSEYVDVWIREQVEAGVFPVRLEAVDWRSGDMACLLDVIAPAHAMATTVLTNFLEIAQVDQINIHPFVTQLVDRDVLDGLVSNGTRDRAAAEPSAVN